MVGRSMRTPGKTRCYFWLTAATDALIPRFIPELHDVGPLGCEHPDPKQFIFHDDQLLPAPLILIDPAVMVPLTISLHNSTN